MKKEEFIFCPLGGSGEIGMNMNLFAYGNLENRKWIIVDIGVTFADDTVPGIDLIYPDPGFIVDKKNDLLGLVLTHAHEDHIGAIAHIWPSAYKASYPPGEAREDWIIFKDLANMMKKPLGYNNVKYLRESINKHIQSKINNDVKKTHEVDFIEENILVKPIDYYYTNSIARSSKVMSECRQISKRFLFTGIEKVI